MKNEIDALMKENQLDGILVNGAGDHNPFMVYLTGGGHITSADLIKIAGKPAVLFHNAMERDEAAKSGLETHSFSQYPYEELMKAVNGNLEAFYALRYSRMLTDLGLTAGRVALYGRAELGFGYGVFASLHRLLPELEFVGLQKKDVLLTAMMTKSDDEIDRIRRMGKVTTGVIGKVAEFLSSQKARSGILTGKDGLPITIGQVKQQINLWLAESGAENPEGTIFSLGYDSAVPHSSGNPSETLRLGETIIFDIFPCEMGGGYYYDCTRTWCLGYAPEKVLQLYEDVSYVYRQITDELQVNSSFKHYQARTCELFEERGHPTVKTKPETEMGYVHSLGHGVGLQIHEKPFSGLSAGEDEILAPGAIFTLEPGLYYPGEKMGVRLEDTLVATTEGRFEILAPFPQDLVIPVKSV